MGWESVTDPSGRRVHWLRILAEGVTIVVSILLAFWLQAWWEGRQDRDRDRSTLERLDAELVAVDSVLIEWRARHVRMIGLSEALLEHAGPLGSSTLSDDSIAALLAPLQGHTSFDAPLATLAALESSGQLAVIPSEALLTRVAVWRGVLDDLRSDEARAQLLTDQDLIPFLYENVAIRTVSAGDRSELAASEPSSFATGYARLLSNRQFENLLEGLRRRLVNILRDYDDARDGLADIRSLIREALR